MLDVDSQHLKSAILIRRFEEMLLALYATGLLNGTVHTCIGQEWSGVALAAATTIKDSVVSNHRGHGHFLARTGNVKGLLAEIMGRATGICSGVGGTQHLLAENYLSSGIQGGMLPIATGIALANKLKGSDAISVACIGDGTLGEGIIYESFNIAAKWELPLVVVLENNRYAQSTASKTTFAGDIKYRALGFGLEYRKADTWNPKNLIEELKAAVAYARSKSQPLLFEVETDRLKAHSKGDDNRPAEEVAKYVARDLLSGIIASPTPEIKKIIADIDRVLASALEEAKSEPFCSYQPQDLKLREETQWTPQPTSPSKRTSEVCSDALRNIFETDSKVVMIGEDICGPYGGAFKISKNLSEKFHDRVRNTPISEAAIVGIGTGLALSGFKAMVEIMFGDFTTLIFDQLHQHAAKFTAMYGKMVPIPLVVRTPMGGRRGYGPTHSQSIEKHFQGIAGLNLIAINNRTEPEYIYKKALASNTPTLLIENKVLYTENTRSSAPDGYEVYLSDEKLPTVRISPRKPLRPELTIFCYGGMLTECEKALEDLFIEHEIVAEVICPTQIAPLNIAPILESTKQTGHLVTVEEGCGVGGFGSEIISRLNELGITPRFKRVSYDDIIPSSFKREMELLPSTLQIIRACLEVKK